MLKAPLPKQVDLRKLASKEAAFSVTFSPSETTRFASALMNTDGEVHAELQFYVDEQHRRRVDGKVKAAVFSQCQRCLGPVECDFESSFTLAIVWSDEQAEALPKDIDPLIWGEEPYDLIDIVEEELLLAFPYVNYHDDMNCVANLSGQLDLRVDDGDKQASEIDDSLPKKPNPFDVLAQLKK